MHIYKFIKIYYLNIPIITHISGISPTALYLEVFSYTVMMSYNYCNGYSILSYMEYPILLAQNFVLVVLVLKYKRLLSQNAYLIALGYFAVTAMALTKILPTVLLSLMVVSIYMRLWWKIV